MIAHRLSPLLGVASGAMLALTLFAAGSSGLIHFKAWFAQQLLERAWQQTLAHGDNVKPWPWADTWPVARLTLPDSGEQHIVLAGGHGQAMAFGPTLLPLQSEVPAANPQLHAIAGHRDTHLAFLATATSSAYIDVQWRDASTQRYRITQRTVVDTRHQSVSVDPDRQGLLLVTCYPFSPLQTGGPLRLVVTAEPVDVAGDVAGDVVGEVAGAVAFAAATGALTSAMPELDNQHPSF